MSAARSGRTVGAAVVAAAALALGPVLVATTPAAATTETRAGSTGKPKGSRSSSPAGRKVASRSPSPARPLPAPLSRDLDLADPYTNHAYERLTADARMSALRRVATKAGLTAWVHRQPRDTTVVIGALARDPKSGDWVPELFDVQRVDDGVQWTPHTDLVWKRDTGRFVINPKEPIAPEQWRDIYGAVLLEQDIAGPAPRLTYRHPHVPHRRYDNEPGVSDQVWLGVRERLALGRLEEAAAIFAGRDHFTLEAGPGEPDPFVPTEPTRLAFHLADETDKGLEQQRNGQWR